MVMKPTPKKLALLMSAIGLGLSLPGVARAHWESEAPPDVTTALGLTAVRALVCDPSTYDASARTSSSTGTGTITSTIQSARAFGDREANALAMVLMADPPSSWRMDAALTAATTASQATASGRRTQRVAVQLPDLTRRLEPATETSDSGTAPPAHRPNARVGATLEPPITTPQATRLASAGAAGATTNTRAPLASTAPAERDTAGSPAPTSAEDAAEHVLSKLVEFSSSRSEALSSPADLGIPQDLAPEPDFASSARIARVERELAALRSAAPTGAAGNGVESARRSTPRPEIVVASHADKVLLSLAALRSDEGPEAGRFGAQTKETVVVRHADKVLLNLASIRAESASPRARSAARPAGDLRRDELPAMPRDAPEPPTSAMAAVRITAAEGAAVAVAPTAALAATPGDAQDSTAPAGQATVALPKATDPLAVTDAAASTDLRGAINTRAATNPIGGDAVALSAPTLDGVRGGFVTDTGLQISFGIERAVYLNGNLVTTTSLNLSDLGKLSAGQAPPVNLGTGGGLTLLQSGSGNTFLPGAISPSAVGTVIQNSLDNQSIQTITRIDAAVSAVATMRALNLQSSLRSAVIDSLHR